MDPNIAVVKALAIGASLRCQPDANESILDSYSGLSQLLKAMHKIEGIDKLEAEPTNVQVQQSIVRQLKERNIAQKPSVQGLTQSLFKSVLDDAPAITKSFGVLLKRAESGGSILVENISSTDNGVNITDSKAADDIRVRDVKLAQSATDGTATASSQVAAQLDNNSAGRDVNVNTGDTNISPQIAYVFLNQNEYLPTAIEPYAGPPVLVRFDEQRRAQTGYAILELKLALDFDGFTFTIRSGLIAELSKLLNVAVEKIQILRIRSGSTFLVLRLPDEHTKQLAGMIQSGELKQESVVDIRRVYDLTGIALTTQMANDTKVGVQAASPNLGGEKPSGGGESTSSFIVAENLSGQSLVATVLRRAKLHNLNFMEADLRAADFREANLENVDFSGADLSGADLSSSRWTKVKLTRAKLTNANLSNVQFDFRSDGRYRNYDANISFGGADLRGANLQGLFLDIDSYDRFTFEGAIYDSATIWPYNFNYAHSGAFGPGADLSRRKLEFTGTQLPGIDLSNAMLQGIRFIEGNFQGANLTDANLSQAELNSTNMAEADLGGADLVGASLKNADLSRADLTNARISDANLWNATLNEASLDGANLRYSNLTRANLNSATLALARLDGANFTSASLADAILQDANCVRAVFKMAHMVRANLAGTTMACADLEQANLSECNLQKADLSQANLKRANLSNADLSNADLSDADLTRADLRGANFKNANLTNTILRFVVSDDNTVWPDEHSENDG